jgi:hypothetical protein
MKCPDNGEFGYPNSSRPACIRCDIKEACEEEYQNQISQEETYERIRDS